AGLAGAPMKAGFREGRTPGSSLANLSLGFSWRIVQGGRDKPAYGSSRLGWRFLLPLSSGGEVRDMSGVSCPAVAGSDMAPHPARSNAIARSSDSLRSNVSLYPSSS